MNEIIKKAFALALAALLTALCACQSEPPPPSPITESGYVAPTYAPLPTATAEPADHAFVAGEALARARASRIENASAYLVREYLRSLEFDLTALTNEMLRIEADNKGVAAAMEHFELSARTALSANEAMERAFGPAKERLATYIPGDASGNLTEISAITISVEGLTWAAMLAFVRGCVQTMRPYAGPRLLEDALHIDTSITYSEENDSLSGTMFVSAQPFTALWARASELPEERLAGRTLYAYLATVYGDDGAQKAYSEPEGAAEALNDISLPVKGTIRKTWYAKRDGGARLHTGTDIIAPEDTPIYACHAGQVTCVSEGVGAGFLVNVMDERGYEFHYYHLERMPSFLKEGDYIEQGQLIGHVGDTGNSSTHHLHLSIIAPTGEYVDPYPYIIAANEREEAGR